MKQDFFKGGGSHLLYFSGSVISFEGGITGAPRQCFGASNLQQQGNNGLEKYQSRYGTIDLKATHTPRSVGFADFHAPRAASTTGIRSHVFQQSYACYPNALPLAGHSFLKWSHLEVVCR